MFNVAQTMAYALILELTLKAANHNILRCDRESDNHKGGIAISVPQGMKPSNVTKLAFHSIEILTSRLMLPNASIIQLALVYRSPSVPLATFVSVVTSLLNYLSQELPTIVMGDFNEDIIDKRDSRILNLMPSNAYTQLVSHPTTDRGTLIDHIYYNRSCDSAVVEVCDAYYSDHDTIYCSLQLSYWKEYNQYMISCLQC